MEVEPNHENGTADNEVLEEFDVFIRVPKKDLYMLHYPLRPYETGITEYENIEGVTIKPDQKKLSVNMSVSSRCENFNPMSGSISYTLTSKIINNRTNYCVGKIDKGNLILMPVNNCFQMRKSFADYEKLKAPKSMKKEQTQGDKKDELQEATLQFRRKENLKQIERKMRTYTFQKELLDSEAEIPLRFAKKESAESRRLVQALLDPPVEPKELKTMDKNEYLKYLF